MEKVHREDAKDAKKGESQRGETIAKSRRVSHSITPHHRNITMVRYAPTRQSHSPSASLRSPLHPSATLPSLSFLASFASLR